MRRILVFVNSFNVGGVTSVVRNIYKSLDKSKFQMDFVRKNWNRNEFDEQVFADGNKVYYYEDCGLNKVPFWNYKRQQLFIARQILKQIKGIHYDAIHIHANPIIGLYIGKKAKIPVRIMHAHEAIPDFGDNVYKSWIMRLIWKNRQKKYNKWATVKAGDSLKACKAKFGEQIENDPRLYILYPPVDMIKFNPIAYGEETELEKNVDATVFNMIHVGRLLPVKNQPFLIDILLEMNKIKNSELYIVGDGEQKKALLDYAKSKGIQEKLHILPPNTSPAIYRKMDCSLLPSFSEAFGMVAVESQLMDVPCFASTNVPHDVNIGMCRFISLSKDAKKWCEYILSPNTDLHIVQSRVEQFKIETLIKVTERLYAGNSKRI